MQLPGRLWLRVSAAKIATDWVERSQTAADCRDSLRFSRNARRQTQFLAGRALARQMLEGLTGQGGTWTFRQDATGRPKIEDEAQQPGPDLSVSHSGDWVACAVAGAGRIGLDLEQARPGRRYNEIAASIFSEPERKAVETDGNAAFLSSWTLREAVAKAEGTGLTGAMKLDGECLMPAFGRQYALTLAGESWAVGHRNRETLHLAIAWKINQPQVDALTLIEDELSKAISR
jgi:phosphopantetheinyl transferase